MTTRVVKELIDDLDGSPASHTVRIGWENEWREIDLSDKNLASLSKGFDHFWDAARRVTGKRTTSAQGARQSKASRSANGSTRDYDRQQFRAWAAESGIKLKRGRPPRDLIDRFLATQG